jgi:hypothetical protein
MSLLVRWTRFALTGIYVGIHVMEFADIGVLYSLLVALFVFFHALMEGDGTPVLKAFRGVARVAVVAVFAGFIAFQAVISLVGLGHRTIAPVPKYDFSQRANTATA